jgi:hypothetical protein
MRFPWRTTSLCLGAVLAFSTMLPPVRAQENSSIEAPKGGQPKPAGATSPGAVVLAPDQSNDSTPAPAPGPVNPYSGDIKEAGTGLPLFGTSSTPLRWGDFSIGRFEYIGLHNNFEPTGSGSGTTTDISLFRTSLMFDHTFWKSRLVLQYLPQLAVIDGQIHANASSNNTFTVGSEFALTPRLRMTLQDAFVQAQENQLSPTPDTYLATNWLTGAVSQNNFFNANGNYLSNSASASFQYDLSPRTSLTATPSFTYARTTSDSTTAQYTVDGQFYQATVALSHALTPYRRVGVSESYQYLRQTSGVPISVRYSTTAVFYSEQLAPSWWVTGNIGTAHQTNTNQSGESGWTFSGGATLAGSFSRRTGVAIAYTRGVTFNNYVSTRLSDRVDATLGLRFSSRFTWNNGGGYFRETGSDPRTSGKYAMTGVSYHFYGNVSCFAAFIHTFQTSNTQQLLSGTQNTVEFGVGWQPPLNAGRR